MERNPDPFGAVCAQGLWHLSLTEYREAAICFHSALEIYPLLIAVRHNLALPNAEGGGKRYLRYTESSNRANGCTRSKGEAVRGLSTISHFCSYAQLFFSDGEKSIVTYKQLQWGFHGTGIAP